MKCKMMKDIKVTKSTKKNEVEMTLRKALLLVKADGKKMFHAIEQGYGRRGNDICVFSSRAKTERKQIV